MEQPPVGGSRALERPDGAEQLPKKASGPTNLAVKLQLISIAVAILAGLMSAATLVFVGANYFNTARTETEVRLTKLINKSTDDLKQNVDKNSNDVSEARRKIEAAATQLNGATLISTNLSKELGAHTTEIQQIKKDTGEIEQIKKDLGENTNETKKIKKDTGEIKEMKDDVASIKDRLQSMRSHDITYLESFHVVVDDNMIFANHYGSVLVFPKNDNKVRELIDLGFVRTDNKLQPSVVRKFGLRADLSKGWAPSRETKRNPSKIVDQASLVTPSSIFFTTKPQ
jgi:hypothetical protein